MKQNDLYPKLSDTYAYLQYSKKNGKKILFFVGNITKNKNQMQAVEILKNTKVFENQDHSCTAEIYLAPVHYKDTDGTGKRSR